MSQSRGGEARATRRVKAPEAEAARPALRAGVPADVRALQRAIGNQAVQRLLAGAGGPAAHVFADGRALLFKEPPAAPRAASGSGAWVVGGALVQRDEDDAIDLANTIAAKKKLMAGEIRTWAEYEQNEPFYTEDDRALIRTAREATKKGAESKQTRTGKLAGMMPGTVAGFARSALAKKGIALDGVADEQLVAWLDAGLALSGGEPVNLKIPSVTRTSTLRAEATPRAGPEVKDGRGSGGLTSTVPPSSSSRAPPATRLAPPPRTETKDEVKGASTGPAIPRLGETTITIGNLKLWQVNIAGLKDARASEEKLVAFFKGGQFTVEIGRFSADVQVQAVSRGPEGGTRTNATVHVFARDVSLNIDGNTFANFVVDLSNTIAGDGWTGWAIAKVLGLPSKIAAESKEDTEEHAMAALSRVGASIGGFGLDVGMFDHTRTAGPRDAATNTRASGSLMGGMSGAELSVVYGRDRESKPQVFATHAGEIVAAARATVRTLDEQAKKLTDRAVVIDAASLVMDEGGDGALLLSASLNEKEMSGKITPEAEAKTAGTLRAGTVSVPVKGTVVDFAGLNVQLEKASKTVGALAYIGTSFNRLKQLGGWYKLGDKAGYTGKSAEHKAGGLAILEFLSDKLPTLDDLLRETPAEKRTTIGGAPPRSETKDERRS